MQRLDEFVTQRHVLARRYNQRLTDLPIQTPWQHEDSYSGYHLYVIRLELSKIDKSHLQVYEVLRGEGVLVNLHYIPVYRQPYYEKMGFIAGHCPQAESYYLEAISIPMYFGLTKLQQDHVIDALMKAFEA